MKQSRVQPQFQNYETTLTQGDVGIIVSLLDSRSCGAAADLWRDTYPRLQFLVPDLYDEVAYRTFLAREDYSHYVGHADDSLVGGLIIRWEARNRVAELYLAGVRRKWRGPQHAVLDQLYDRALADMAAKDIDLVFAQVRPQNVFARSFLIRHEFTEHDRPLRGRELVRLPSGELKRDSYIWFERLLAPEDCLTEDSNLSGL